MTSSTANPSRPTELHGEHKIGATLFFDRTHLGDDVKELRVVRWREGPWMGVDVGGGFYDTEGPGRERGIVTVDDFKLKDMGMGVTHQQAYWTEDADAVRARFKNAWAGLGRP